MSNSAIRALLVLGMLLMTGPVQAEPEYYVWVDENGVTNYAARKPNDRQAQHITPSFRFGEVRRPKPEPAPTPTPGEQPADVNAPVDPDALVEDQRAQIEKENARRRDHNCNMGQQMLLRYEAFGRIRETDANGEMRILTEEEMEANRAEARRIISENCTA